ncbi:Elongation of very long chain fatty acids protein 4 [Hypsibius exemplaris]|uniref:Elongation of very long chain fatty acids protein n=1 Tax=Hypsibius exemplaris TaxID=2072580 RepID=A0A1W0WW12_HYPEX|nr:Elongation of very long chain fatty acids protein 4 [Hypsibius exemplaris]
MDNSTKVPADLPEVPVVIGYIDWLYSISDPRVAEWPLMSSHWPTLFITFSYLGFVKYGPRVMRHRPPVKLEPVMIGYNLGIAALNAFISYNSFVAATRLGYSYVCQEVVYSNDPEELRMAGTIWYFYVSKIIELLDTVFLILRKKNSQLSFLHVYHHATMVVFWYIGARWVAGGSAFFPTMTNAFIHVLMYAYYGLAALGPKVRRLLWWKPYLTQIQMGQFILGIYFGVQSFFVPCRFPLWMKHGFIIYMASLLILFANFYRQRYYYPAKNEAGHDGERRSFDAAKKRHLHEKHH